ncbi:hypothetical protein F5Y19DRAFT_462334 [Xylariaceae sp. FL1651]|nr:hypothetical protein F5Y19DRAFT_462334 [Xylariaceae sp. FL1651]
MAVPSLGLEIPAFGAPAAHDAVVLGATRIELNALGSYNDGGLSPSVEDLQCFSRAANPKIPLRIMIRPRGPPFVNPLSKARNGDERDFLYRNEEFEMMEASIRAVKDTGLLKADRGDGFVFGILEEEGTVGWKCWVDKKRCTRLVQEARPFKAVFHRAFDEIVSCDSPASEKPAMPSWETGLKDVAACGFDGILTSGGLGKAINNIETLGKIIQKAETLGVEIIIGGGVRTANVGELIRRLGLREKAGSVYLHSACLYGDGREDIHTEEVQGILAQLR